MGTDGQDVGSFQTVACQGRRPDPNGRAPHTQCSPMDLVRLLSAMVPTFHAVEVDLLATRLIAASSAGRLAIILVVTAWLAP